LVTNAVDNFGLVAGDDEAETKKAYKVVENVNE
jgi:hypothetical protein